MTEDEIQSLLGNYTALVEKIDRHIQRLEKKYLSEIACKKGCDACCRNLSLFPVEALNLSLAFAGLEKGLKQAVIKNIKATPNRCPLLINHVCALYNKRPMICRTHGYPLLIKSDNEIRVDFCPDNFKTIESFSGDDLLNLEQLNTTLLAVNQHFLTLIEPDDSLLDRLSMADALFIFKNDKTE